MKNLALLFIHTQFKEIFHRYTKTYQLIVLVLQIHQVRESEVMKIIEVK